MGRKTITMKTRFEVFKRDLFTCQYCGKKSPDVILEIDHIKPVSKGGENILMNLLTSCFECNRGKSNREIDDNSILSKQRQQIEELNMRREQIEMMLKWRDGEIKLKNIELDKASDYFQSKTDKFCLSEKGLNGLNKLVKKFGLMKVLDAIDVSFDKYYKSENDIELVIKKIGGILHYLEMPEEKKKIAYIIGICKNKWDVYNHGELSLLLNKYHENEYCLDELKEKLVSNQFKSLRAFIYYLQ